MRQVRLCPTLYELQAKISGVRLLDEGRSRTCDTGDDDGDEKKPELHCEALGVALLAELKSEKGVQKGKREEKISELMRRQDVTWRERRKNNPITAYPWWGAKGERDVEQHGGKGKKKNRLRWTELPLRIFVLMDGCCGVGDFISALCVHGRVEKPFKGGKIANRR